MKLKKTIIKTKIYILISFLGTANECNFFTITLVKLKSFCTNLIICAKFEISTRQPPVHSQSVFKFPHLKEKSSS